MSCSRCPQSPSNMQNFSENSYNLTGNRNSWCVKPGSIYTNKNARFNYFTPKCGDPYTYYSYWYRRFPDQTRYLNCYNLPYKDVMLQNKYGYVRNKGQCNVSTASSGSNAVINGFKVYQ